MNDADLIDIIHRYSLTVRCLPYKTTHTFSYREGQKLKDNQRVVELPECNNKKYVREIREVDKGGWWYVIETTDTNSTVTFNRKYDKFFAPTLKEAIKLFLESKQ